MKLSIAALLLIASFVSVSANAQPVKKRSPANILVTVQGVLAGVEAKKVKIKTDDGRTYYVPRHRVDLESDHKVGEAKVRARMTLQELSNLNPFVRY